MSATLPPARQAPIDAVCRRFEDAWRRGQTPRLEDYLAEGRDEDRTALFCELLRLELRHRGAPASATDYEARFPGAAAEVRAVFAETATIPPAAAGATTPSLAARAGPESRSVGEDAGGDAPRFPAVPGCVALAELGRGGMGVVYKARQVALGRVVALKMILSGGHAGDEDMARFRTEAEAIARLQHPNIVQIFEVGTHDGLPYFTLEFCPGGSLDRKLKATPLPPAEAAALVETLARAIQAAHDKGVIHRDLKPANVLLAEDGTPKITDFGLAKKLDEAGQTQSGAVMGTPSYMAPEQAGLKGAVVGPHSDTYALGAILYECLAGRPPFKAATVLDTILQVVNDEPVPVKQLNGLVPIDLETICHKCLQKDPAKRYASAAALADDLGRFRRGEPIRARPVGRTERAAKWVRRNPVVAVLLAVSVLAVAAVLVVILVSSARLGRMAIDLGVKEGEVKVADENNRIAGGKVQVAQAELDRLRPAVEQEKRHSEQDLGRAYTARGLVAAEQGDLRAALTLFAAAVKADDGDAERRDLFRRRFHGFSLAFPRPVHALPVEQGDDCFAVPSPDGRVLVIVGAGGKAVRAWDTLGGEPVAPPLAHGGPVQGVAFSPDSTRLLTRGEEPLVRCWEVRSGRLLFTLALRDGGDGAEFSPDGRLILTRNYTPVAAEAAALLGQAASPWRTPFGLAAPLALGQPDRVTEFRVWDAATGQPLPAYLREPVGTTVTFSPDSTRLFTARSTARAYDARTGRPVTPPVTPGGRPIFAPGGKHILAVAQPDFRIRNQTVGQAVLQIWDAATAALVARLENPGKQFKGRERLAYEFAPDGRLLATGSGDGKVCLWETATGKAVATPLDDGSPVTKLAFSPDGRFLVCALRVGTRRQLRCWQTKGGKSPWPDPIDIEGTFPEWGADIELRLTFSPDGRFLLAGGPDTTEIFDLARGVSACPPLAGGGSTFLGDGRRVLTGGGAVWDLAPRQPAAVFLGDRRAVPGAAARQAAHQDVALSDDGRRVLTSEFDPGTGEWEARVWDTATGRPLTESLSLGRGASDQQPADLSPDGERLLTVSANHEAVIRRVGPGRPEQPPRLLDLAQWATYSLDGRRVLLFAPNGNGARVFDALTGDALTGWLKDGESVTDALFSPDGRRVVTLATPGAAGPSRVQFWDAATGEARPPRLDVPGAAKLAGFSPDGRRLVVLDESAQRARLWDAETGAAVGSDLPHAVRAEPRRRDVFSAWPALSPDGAWVVTENGIGQTTMWLWEAATGRAVVSLPGGSPSGRPVFSPDNRWLVHEANEPGLRLWDLPKREASTVLAPDGTNATPPRFSGDARRLLGGDKAGLRVWDVDTGKPLGSWPPERMTDGGWKPSWAGDFTPDRQRVVSVSYDQESHGVQVWEAATGRLLASPWSSTAASWARPAVAVTRDGNRALVTDTAAPASLWDLSADDRPADDLILLARVLTGRRLDDGDNVVAAEPADVRAAWEELRRKYPAEFAAPPAEDAVTWSRLVAYEEEEGRPWVARWHLDRLIAADPNQGLLYVRRASLAARQGDWGGALADCRKAVELRPNGQLGWRWLALLSLSAGDAAGYRRACTRLADAADDHSCLVGPDGLADWSAVLRRAQNRARQTSQIAVAFQAARDAQAHLGHVLYRAGRAEQAIPHLERATQGIKEEQNRDVVSELFLAMAHQRAGHRDEARRWLEKSAVPVKRPTSPAAQVEAARRQFQAAAKPQWERSLEMELLRREAEGLVRKP